MTDQSIPPPALFEGAAHGVAVLGETIAECNAQFCRMLDHVRADVVGRTLLHFSPEVQSDGAFSSERWQRRWQAARAGLAQWFPWQFRHRDGRRVHALIHLGAGAGDGAPLVADVHDLSHSGEAGWTEPDSHSRLQQVLDHTKAVIFVKDRGGRYLFANRELERLVRTPAGRIVGRTDHELWPQDIAERFRRNDAQVLTERRAIEFEVAAEVGRQLRTFQSFKFPLFGADGAPYAVCGIAADITERKRTQDALTRAALAVSSAQGASVFQELVRYLATILEVDAALIATPHEDLGPHHMRMHAFILDGKVRENFDYPIAGTPCETVVGQNFRFYSSGLRQRFPADGDFSDLGLESYAGFPLTDGAGAPLGLIAAISREPMEEAEFVESILQIFAVRAAAELERQRADETLRRSEASYRAIFEASEDAIFVHDWNTGAVIDVNPRACEVYGYGYEELKRTSVDEVSSGVHPYTGAEAARLLERAKAGQTVRTEWHRRNKDGSLHWDEVVLRSAVIAGQRRVLAFTREITERKQAEHALRQAQKMEALGHLTGGIAHDFNNLLTSIMGYVVLAADRPAASGDARLAKYLDQAAASCGRARDLIQQMLTFSRGRRGEPRPVSLPALVGEAVRLYAASFPATIEIETRIAPEVPPVMLDPVHLDQVLLNLCLNARDAMEGVGTLRVSVEPARGAARVCTACHQGAHGDFVELAVEDTGPGIAADIIDRIFDPFFTTKEIGKGSGMGLASVHGIVHESGGHIVVDTARGRGTRFRVLLPALPEARDTDAGGGAPAPVERAHLRGRVLVVDDERSVGAFMRELLESRGLEVTLANSAAEALALAGEGARNFDLVITDQTMPRTTGIQLARELLAARQDLPVILYTGLNEGLGAEIDAAALRAVITKPVDARKLFALLEAHLPRAPGG